MVLKCFPRLGIAATLVLLYAAVAVGAPPEPPIGPIPEPLPLMYANVAVDPPTISPSPVVPLSSGYTVRVAVKSTGTISATSVKLRVELRTSGTVLQQSEVFLGDMSAGTTRTVTMPALFDTPAEPTFELVAAVSAGNDILTGDNQAVSTPLVLSLPLVLHWAGFDVTVTYLNRSSTLTSMSGNGDLLIPTTPPARVPIAFTHVEASPEGKVLSADTVSAPLSPAVEVSGSNGVRLRLSKVTLPAAGPLSVTGYAVLPESAGVEAINGKTIGEFTDKELTPDLVLHDAGFSELKLRDLPLLLSPSGPIHLSLANPVLFSVDGDAKGYPSWDMSAPGLVAAENATNDGMFVGTAGMPSKFSVTGVLRSNGLACKLKLQGSSVAYPSLFPRALVSLSGLEVTLTGGMITEMTGQAQVAFNCTNSLPLDPHLVPTSYQFVLAKADISATDSGGGFAGRASTAQPADGIYGWGGLAPPSDVAHRVFYVKDQKPVLFMLGGLSTSLPHLYFVSRLKAEPDGSFRSYPHSIGSAEAPLDPGLNIVTDVTSAQSEQAVVMNLTGSSGPMALAGPKVNLYLRAGGVSGVWGSSTDAANPAKTEMYGKVGPGEWGEGRGFPIEFTNVSIGFLDTDVRSSNLAGNITLRAPMGTGVAGENRFAFAGMTVKRDGQLGEANVPPAGASPQELAFWKAWVEPKGVYFTQVNDYLGTTKTFLGLNAKLAFAQPGDTPKYIRDPFAVDGLLFGGPGHPHPTRLGQAHLGMDNRWMDFQFHPTGVRLSDPDDSTDPSDPSTPVPWSDDNAPAAKATVEARPGTPGGPAATGKPGWVQVDGMLKVPFFGEKAVTTYIDARDDYVTLSEPLSLSRELFAGMTIGGTFVFQQKEQDSSGTWRPNAFLCAFNWSLPANLLSADGGIQLFDRELGKNKARLYLGGEANIALLDTAMSYLDKAATITNTAQRNDYINKTYSKLGIVGKDYDPEKAAALAQKITGPGSPVPRGWASVIEGGINTAHSFMKDLYSFALDASGALAPASDYVNSVVQKALNATKGFNTALPVKLRFLRGSVELYDDQWDTIELDAGLRVERVIQDAEVKFRMNRHNEYRLDLEADKVTIPFTDIAASATNTSEKRSDGLSIKDPYLRLYLALPPAPHAPRLDGSFGCGEFNILDAIRVAGASIPPPTNEGLQVTHLDASFGVGVGVCYIGAGIGLKGKLIASYLPADSVSASFLAGAGIDEIALDMTGVLNPEVKAALMEGLAASGAGASLNGLAIGAGFSKTLIDIWVLKAGYGIDAAVWTFLVISPSSTDAVLGGRLYGTVYGTALRIVSVRGELALLVQYTTANNNLKAQGTGRVSGSIDLFFYEIEFGAGIKVLAQTNADPHFDVDVDW